MNARIQKWGNSLAVRIPKAAAEDAGLIEGSEVDLRAVKGGIVVRPLRKKKSYTLAYLLKGVRKDNLHKEVDWGRPMGREVW
jgi:antitoxin MazE